MKWLDGLRVRHKVDHHELFFGMPMCRWEGATCLPACLPSTVRTLSGTPWSCKELPWSLVKITRVRSLKRCSPNDDDDDDDDDDCDDDDDDDDDGDDDDDDGCREDDGSGVRQSRRSRSLPIWSSTKATWL